MHDEEVCEDCGYPLDEHCVECEGCSYGDDLCDDCWEEENSDEEKEL